MNKEFIPYEQALALKELGFDEPCLNKFYTKPNSKMFSIDEKGRHYPIKNTAKKLYTIGEYFVLKDDNVIITPLYQQAFRWFREKHRILYNITYADPVDMNYQGVVYKPHDKLLYLDNPPYITYEEAELACLNKLIELIKTK